MIPASTIIIRGACKYYTQNYRLSNRQEHKLTHYMTCIIYVSMVFGSLVSMECCDFSASMILAVLANTDAA